MGEQIDELQKAKKGQKATAEVPEPVIKDEDPNAEREESEQIDSAAAPREPTATLATSTAVAKVEELDVAPEVREVDHLLEVKAWAMQSPGWKMLNVIFETVSHDQLQYTCKNGKSVFENMALLLKLALTNAWEYKDNEKKAMTQVKSYILGYLLPKAINRSLKFLTPKLTLIYL